MQAFSKLLEKNKIGFDEREKVDNEWMGNKNEIVECSDGMSEMTIFNKNENIFEMISYGVNKENT